MPYKKNKINKNRQPRGSNPYNATRIRIIRDQLDFGNEKYLNKHQDTK
jgi:hypothetical protein